MLDVFGGAHTHADETAVVFQFDPQQIIFLNAVGVRAERDEMLILFVGEREIGWGSVSLQ